MGDNHGAALRVEEHLFVAFSLTAALWYSTSRAAIALRGKRRYSHSVNRRLAETTEAVTCTYKVI